MSIPSQICTLLLGSTLAVHCFGDEPQPVLVHQVGGFNTDVWTGGKRLGIVIKDARAYLGGDQFYVFDVTWPTGPALLGSCQLPAVARDVAIAGNFAFVAAGDEGLRVIDVSDPKKPTEVASLAMPGVARCVAADGKWVYVGDPAGPADQEAGAVRLIDASDPHHPRLVGSYEYPSVVLDIHVGERYVYVGDRRGRVLIVDYSDPLVPKLVGEARGLHEVTGVKVAGNYLHVSDNDSAYHIVDISDPSAPRKIGSIRCDGIGRLPVQDPKLDNPSSVHWQYAPGLGSDVHPDGRFAWVTGVTGRVALMDHTDKSSPRVVALFDTRLRAYGVAVQKGYAYINCDEGRLVVLQRASGLEQIQKAAHGLVASFSQPSYLKTIAPSLVAMGSEGAKALVPALYDAKGTVRSAASHVLSYIQPDDNDIDSATTAWIAAIKDRRGEYTEGPVVYVRRILMNLKYPAASEQAIVDALIGELNSGVKRIQFAAMDTLAAVGRHRLDCHQLVMSRLKMAQLRKQVSPDTVGMLQQKITEAVEE